MIDPNNKDMPRWARERLEAEMGMGVAETSASPFLIVIVLGAVALRLAVLAALCVVIYLVGRAVVGVT